jgi:uncharacterized protein GlcG (DUF336 family)
MGSGPFPRFVPTHVTNFWGGIPLIEDGKIIGAIGCSGDTGSQDEAICMARASVVNK